MVAVITTVEEVVGVINGVLFLLPLISKRVRRFLIKVAISDIIMSLTATSSNGEITDWVESLCLYYEMRRKRAVGMGSVNVNVREEND